MASITIRRIPEPTKERLRIRAARSGLSLEAYTRQILQTASQADTEEPLDLAELAQACFGPDRGIDLKLPPRGDNRPPLSFD
jgi:plasmid stability protein